MPKLLHHDPSMIYALLKIGDDEQVIEIWRQMHPKVKDELIKRQIFENPDVEAFLLAKKVLMIAASFSFSLSRRQYILREIHRIRAESKYNEIRKCCLDIIFHTHDCANEWKQEAIVLNTLVEEPQSIMEQLWNQKLGRNVSNHEKKKKKRGQTSFERAALIKTDNDAQNRGYSCTDWFRLRQRLVDRRMNPSAYTN